MIKRSSRRTFGVVAVSLALVACGDDPVDPGPNEWGPDPRGVEFAESLGIDLDSMTETASGLFYRDDVVGTGEAAALGDAATVSYTGWLVLANEFDSGSFPLTLAEGQAIAGFVEGIIGMQLGGTRTIVMPSSLGYGSVGKGQIPGDAVLVFELTLTSLVKI
jgi:FKBP-type peptidyl-prolyl cis-trans isomerase FkpA